MEIGVTELDEAVGQGAAFLDDLSVNPLAAGVDHAIEIDYVADLETLEIGGFDRQLQPDCFSLCSLLCHSSVSLRR